MSVIVTKKIIKKEIFFLLTFKPEENQNNNNLKIIKDNQKWFCDLHYKDYVHLKDSTWSEVLKNNYSINLSNPSN